MAMKDRITSTLQVLDPVTLEVIDESENHRGHGGWREGGETHFRIRIAARGLDGLSRVACHRRINTLLADEFARGLHALAIEARGAGPA
ncbi:MAG: BolA family transcriptional regulator [Proteobacteria bacterium]|nr:BolA family transcriptional regulator [Pseudomonadota bacterium]